MRPNKKERERLKKLEEQYTRVTGPRVSEHPRIAEINAAIRRGWNQSQIVKTFQVSRQSISRYCRNQLGIRNYPRYQEKTKRGIAQQLAIPCSDYFVQMPNEALPAHIAARADICVLEVVYAPQIEKWITKDKPFPPGAFDVTEEEIGAEIAAQKLAIELAIAEREAAFQASLPVKPADPVDDPLAASFDPVADDPLITAHDQTATRPASPPSLPSDPTDAPLANWLSYFKVRRY